MKQVLFIVNPQAGPRSAPAFGPRVARELDPRKFHTEIAYTRYPGHGTELAAAAVRAGVAIIVAVGGDGSVNEVARGMIGSPAVLAIVPRGSGNGLARTLGISRRRALQIIREGACKRIDVGQANGHLFLSNAGVGFDALIARMAARSTHRGLGAYSLQVLRELRRYQPVKYTLRGEDFSQEVSAFLVNVANGGQFGYNFKIAAEARLDDGILDGCIMPRFPLLALPAVVLTSLKRGLAGTAYARHLPCRELRISAAEGPLEWMQLDGDPVPVVQGVVHIRVIADILQVLSPR